MTNSKRLGPDDFLVDTIVFSFKEGRIDAVFGSGGVVEGIGSKVNLE
jgi:hypothetical protein